MALAVAKVLSASSSPSMIVSPRAIAPIISARCEIVSSPGTRSVPRSQGARSAASGRRAVVAWSMAAIAVI